MWEMLQNYFHVLLQDRFNSGYIAGLAAALVIILLFLFLRTVLVFRFRERSTKLLIVRTERGKNVISADVLVASIGNALRRFPTLALHEVKIRQIGGNARGYHLILECGFDASQGDSFPECSSKMREALFAALSEEFEIHNLRRIDVHLEDYRPDTAAVEHALAPRERIALPGDDDTSSDMGA